MLEGAFNELTPAQVAATMSCLVASDRSKDDEDPAKGLPAELRAPLKMLQEAARRVGRVSEEAGIEIEIDDYVKSMSPCLMPVIYSWANGARFSEIVKMTKEFEGSIIRVIRRLEELLRQLADAARAVGDEALDAKFKSASASMRRDIVFAASLYT
jgi:ATP-dependent RNA helicase DOB1